MQQRTQKKRKVDYVALKSPFMRIPRMDVSGARALLDLGFAKFTSCAGATPSRS